MSIRIRNLDLSSGSKPLLTRFRADFTKGKIHALCGPNGSGKSLLFDAIAGMPQQYPEQIMWESFALLPTQVAYAEQRARLYNNMTGIDYLKFLGVYHGGLSDELLEAFTLPFERPLDSYSFAMLRQLQLIGALAEDKPVILLDEPFAGMDAAATETIKRLLRHCIRPHNVIVLAVSQSSEIRDCCDAIHFLGQGRLEEMQLHPTSACN